MEGLTPIYYAHRYDFIILKCYITARTKCYMWVSDGKGKPRKTLISAAPAFYHSFEECQRAAIDKAHENAAVFKRKSEECSRQAGKWSETKESEVMTNQGSFY